MYPMKCYFLPYKASRRKPVTLQRSGSFNSSKVDLPEESKEIYNLGMLKQSPATGVRVKSNEQALRKSFFVPNNVPQDIPDGLGFRTQQNLEKRPYHFLRMKSESCEDKHPINSVTDKFDKTISPHRFSDQAKC